MARLGWISLAVVTACGVLAPLGLAGISGPCSASLSGENVATRGTGATAKPIVVAHGSEVPIVLSSKSGLTHVKIALEFAGLQWVVKDKDVSTPVYRDTIPVKNYDKYGVGLYKVSGTGTGDGFSCTGAALVKVKGSPVSTAAGIGGIAATVLGLIGLVVGGLRARGGVKPLRVVLTTLSGLVAAVGILALLQEASVVYPTSTVAIIGLAIGAVVGALVGVVPGLGHQAAPAGTPVAPAA